MVQSVRQVTGFVELEGRDKLEEKNDGMLYIGQLELGGALL